MLGVKLISNCGDCSKLALLVCLPYPQSKWKKLCSAPKKISQMHAVLDREEKMMYVGGFEAGQEILCYNRVAKTWYILPPCPMNFFAIAYFMDKLIAVGGLTDDDTVVGTVYEFNEAITEWVESVDIPPMPTPRSTPTVIVRHGPSPAIAACGGLKQEEDEKRFVTGEMYASTPHGRSPIATCEEFGGVQTGKNRKPCDTVEVYSSHDMKQWHKGVSLPYFRYWMSSVTIQNKCYLLGGYSYGRNYKECISADLDSLMDTVITGDSACATTLIWEPIEDIPLIGATAARFGENLVAIGGQDDDDHTSTAVYILTGDGSWEELPSAVLPEPCKQAAAINLSSGELIIIGGSFHPKEQNTSVKKADALIISASATREH